MDVNVAGATEEFKAAFCGKAGNPVCGRYYMDDETAGEINKMIYRADGKVKKTFRDSVEHRRIVIPAAWFYEWNRKKEKNIFYRKEQPVLFMAGIYKRYQGEERFVILTTKANASMELCHSYWKKTRSFLGYLIRKRHWSSYIKYHVY